MKNRYRVVIECEVETFDMTPERMQQLYEQREEHMKDCESCRLAGHDDPPTDESLAEQRVLRNALVSNPQALDLWMQHEVLATMAEWGLEEAAPGATEAEILKPVVETLPAKLRHRYREALARGELFDVAPEFFESFHVDIVDVAIEPS